MLHRIHVYPHKVKCSCGFHKSTQMTGAESLRWGYIHAHSNLPAVVIDLRMCSQRCRDEQKARGWKEPDNHIHDCPNYITEEVSGVNDSSVTDSVVDSPVFPDVAGLQGRTET